MIRTTHINILDVEFIHTTRKQLINQTINHYGQKPIFLVTANPEIVMHAQESQHYNQILKSADYVIADGIGIIIASKILKNPCQKEFQGLS
ncbi:hypothetical protein [Piscibacillus salipiscarius]|uniref:hypothetical protein n=1 Tax=Piscibacillus salipiscarius TaxID=299480 RepID=UPI000AEF7F17